MIDSTTGGTVNDYTFKRSDIETISAKTNQLNFTGTDVKATLDGEEVTTDSDSRTASQADISTLETSTQLGVVNVGVQKASKLIPHSTDL